MTLSKKPTFGPTDLSQPITEVALAITTFKGDNFSPGGTACVIAPHLAITARHVFDGDWKYFEGTERPHGDIEGSFSIFVQQTISGNIGAIWQVTRLWPSNFADVVFLRLSPYSESSLQYKNWKCPTINFDPPELGSRISGFGYHSSATEINGQKIKWNINAATTIGEVIDILDDRMPPLFVVNAKFENHMSGGPIFNDKGQLCGIIKSSFVTSDNDCHTSIVSMLWPSMGTHIDMSRDGFKKGKKYPVLDLAKDGFIDSPNWNRINVEKLTDSQTKISFKKHII